jgi:hypothetical protein
MWSIFQGKSQTCGLSFEFSAGGKTVEWTMEWIRPFFGENPHFLGENPHFWGVFPPKMGVFPNPLINNAP